MSFDSARASAGLENDFGEDFAYGSRTYLNNASVSLMPKSSVKAMTDFLAEYNALGPDSDAADCLVSAKIKSARSMLSEILSCRPDEVSFAQSTTDGINMVAGGLRTLDSGARVIIRGMEHEHHANLYPWLQLRNRGVVIKSLGIDKMGMFAIDEISPLLDSCNNINHKSKDCPRTRLVALSHALYNTGAILPVGRVGGMICDSNCNEDDDDDENRCMFFLDAAQTIGCMAAEDCNVSAIKCDYMSFNGSKWLCGPMGMGVFFCRNKAGNMLDPISIGGESATLHDNNDNNNNNNSVTITTTDSARLSLKDAPDRFQTGFRNYAGIAGLEASLRYLEAVGFAKIRTKNRGLSELLKDELDSIRGVCTLVPDDSAARTSIISFNVEGHDPRDVVARLEKRGIILAVRELGSMEMIRASPHFFNTEAQMHALADAIRRL